MGSPPDSSLREEDAPRVPNPRVSGALLFMEENLHRSSLTVADIASQVGLSRSGFSRLFRAETGSRAGRMLLRMRMELAGDLLVRERALLLKEVAARIGFPRADVFARVFREWFGVTPSEFRRSRR